MKLKEKTKLEIEQLKDEKEDIKWKHSSSSTLLFGAIIFLGTTLITLISDDYFNLTQKLIILFFSLILFGILIILFNYVYNTQLKELNTKIKKLNQKYESLLNK